MIKETVPVCAWCPDKKQRDAEVVAQGKIPSHTICRSCAEAMEVQEKTFEILSDKK